MCELFAISSDAPTDVRFSLKEFSRHGGCDCMNVERWGWYSILVNVVLAGLHAIIDARLRIVRSGPKMGIRDWRPMRPANPLLYAVALVTRAAPGSAGRLRHLDRGP